MSTTLSPMRIADVPSIEDSTNAMAQIRSGLANAASEIGIPELGAALRENDRPGGDWAEHPGVSAWEENVIDPACVEVAPLVAELLREAIRRRLPWTWEPDR